MNLKFAAILFLSGIFSAQCSFSQNEKEITGHWIAVKGDPFELKTGDTLTLKKTKQTDKTYQWGGVASGFEFLKDGSFHEYHNVMCSTESSPVYHTDERWKILPSKNKSQRETNNLQISGSERNFTFRIIRIKDRQLIPLKE